MGAAYFLLLEAAVGGCIALLWVHLRGEVARGFTMFTGVCLLIVAVLAVWLRNTFPPPIGGPTSAVWFGAERASEVGFVVLLGAYLVGLRRSAGGRVMPLIGPLVPLVGLASLWSASLVAPGGQLFGLGEPLATLAGAMALGTSITALSLGHWYLVSPSMSVRPLIRLTLLCLGALTVQVALVAILLLVPGAQAPNVGALVADYGVFLGVRVVFGLVVPLISIIMTWRTARIRSLDSATGLLYIVVALILAGEIAARTLYFLTGVAT